MSKVDYSKWDNLEDSDEEKPKKASPAPSASKQQEPPSSGGFFNDEDPRAEVEKLKAKKRAERAAHEMEREAARAANPDAAPAPSPAPAPAPAPAAAVVPKTPAEKVLSAEATMAAMLNEIAALTIDLPSEKKDPELAAAGAAKHRLVALQGEVGRLQNMVDDISIGEIEDEVLREDMRGRRKKVNRWLEEEASAQVQKLKKL